MTLKQRIQHIQQLITNTEQACNRTAGSVLLLAVSKKHNVSTIKEAFALGITHFGENYYQEALEKITQLEDLNVCWHFIGPIQSNKAKGIATHFDWVHSINRFSVAEQLNNYRPLHKPPLNVCLQINLVAEPTKSGITSEQAKELAKDIQQLPRLKLRGLMLIPPVLNNAEEQYQLFIRLNELLHSLNHELDLHMDTLSMGMSDDLIPAIHAGATIIRVGRALFGERQ